MFWHAQLRSIPRKLLKVVKINKRILWLVMADHRWEKWRCEKVFLIWGAAHHYCRRITTGPFPLSSVHLAIKVNQIRGLLGKSDSHPSGPSDRTCMECPWCSITEYMYQTAGLDLKGVAAGVSLFERVSALHPWPLKDTKSRVDRWTLRHLLFCPFRQNSWHVLSIFLQSSH